MARHTITLVSNPPDYQVTYWRDLPSMVVVRDGDTLHKAALAGRFQEAIDEAAMRLGDVGSDAYLEGWRRGEWTAVEAGPTDGAAARLVADLERQWDDAALGAYLDGLGPADT